jgi:hypothetical protein
MDFPSSEIKPKSITVTLNGNPSLLDAMDTVSLSAEELAAYAREFYSGEVDATYKLYVDSGQLLVKIRNKPARPLTPLGKDQFEAAGTRLNFERDVSGRVARFGVDAGRGANVHFEKKWIKLGSLLAHHPLFSTCRHCGLCFENAILPRRAHFGCGRAMSAIAIGVLCSEFVDRALPAMRRPARRGHGKRDTSWRSLGCRRAQGSCRGIDSHSRVSSRRAR